MARRAARVAGGRMGPENGEAMKYLLLIYGTEAEMYGPHRQECIERSAKVVEDLDAKGQFISASPLQPVATATSVRIRNGKTVVTDGPFAETREALGGYYLVDVADLDEAIAIANRIPVAEYGTVEIRPLQEIAALLPR
jgi:hypothetical protein